MTQKFINIYGFMCSGKSTLTAALKNRGFVLIDESIHATFFERLRLDKSRLSHIMSMFDGDCLPQAIARSLVNVIQSGYFKRDLVVDDWIPYIEEATVNIHLKIIRVDCLKEKRRLRDDQIQPHLMGTEKVMDEYANKSNVRVCESIADINEVIKEFSLGKELIDNDRNNDKDTEQKDSKLGDDNGNGTDRVLSGSESGGTVDN